MFFRVFSVFFVFIYLLVCFIISIIDVWQEFEFKKSSMKDVLVVGMVFNFINWFLFEIGFIVVLIEYGIKVIVSYIVIGDVYFIQEVVEKYLVSYFYDYIIVMFLGVVDVEMDYVLEFVCFYYIGLYYFYWGLYWGVGNIVIMICEVYIDIQINVILIIFIFDFED